VSRQWPLPDDLNPPEPTPEELNERKRRSDRKHLLDHIDYVRRLPYWVYDDIEEAIGHAIAGKPNATIESREGRYTATELIECWEIDEELLDLYRRPVDDPSYEDSFGW
jgi:hypothetical protein